MVVDAFRGNLTGLGHQLFLKIERQGTDNAQEISLGFSRMAGARHLQDNPTQPFGQDVDRIALAVSLTNTFRNPATNLIGNVRRAFYSPQPVPHAMPESMDRIALASLHLEPFVQSTAG